MKDSLVPLCVLLLFESGVHCNLDADSDGMYFIACNGKMYDGFRFSFSGDECSVVGKKMVKRDIDGGNFCAV